MFFDEANRVVRGVVVDAGHGGDDPGAVANGEEEKNFNLRAAQYMYQRLQELGIPSVIIRDTDETLSRDERVSRALEAFGNDPNVILISNHINAGGGEGAEVVYALRNSSDLARMITEEIGKEGQIIRKYYQRRLPEDPMRDYYYIQRLTGNLESLLIEYGFIDNTNDIRKLRANLTNYVEGVVRAIANYTGYNYTPPGLQQGNIYTVQKGDSLWLIAQRFNTTVQELKDLNNLTSNTLQIGQVLRIPSLSTDEDNNIETTIYIVQRGDSLWTIAEKFNTTVQELKNLNNLTSEILQVGQELLVKETTETIPPTTEPETGTTYIVQRGDSLWSIANKYNITVQELKDLNNLTSNTLSIGQVLTVPSTDETTEQIYIVQRGDSLWLIAQKYNVSVNDLINANNLTTTTINIGDELIIPTTNTTTPGNNTYIVQRGDTIFMGNNG